MKHAQSAPSAVVSSINARSGERVSGFHSSDLRAGMIFDCRETMYPSWMEGFVGGHVKFSASTRHHFGFVISGKAVLRRANLPDQGIQEGMYFSAPGAFELEGDAKICILIREGYRGLFGVGGPVEKTGRLCYIDNCSVSELVPPARLGDPTFQYLVFPPGVNQSQHIHPTIRLGMVVAGSGHCRTADGSRFDLQTGQVFYLEERYQHGFVTDNGEMMAVVAFHPDSDVGPTDDKHPMLSRTYLQDKK